MREYESTPALSLFCTFSFASVIVLIILSILTRGEVFNFVMDFNYESYVFGDHFDSVMYGADHPYSIWLVTYPPLITLVYTSIGWFTIPYINANGSDLARELAHSDTSLFVFVIFMAISICIFHTICIRILSKKYEYSKCEILFLCVLFSLPVLYALERGNCIFYALDGMLLFLLGYRSEKKWIRLSSYFCLAVAVNIKLYPALLAVLILRERDYRGFVECTLMSLILFFGLFIFTDGNPIDFFKVLFSYTSPTSGIGTGTYIGIRQWVMGVGNFLFGNSLNLVGFIIAFGLLLICIVLILIDKGMPLWQALGLLGCNMAIGIGVPTLYGFMYLIPALLYFMVQNEKFDKSMICVALLFSLIMILVPSIPFFKSAMTFALMLLLMWLSYKRMFASNSKCVPV